MTRKLIPVTAAAFSVALVLAACGKDSTKRYAGYCDDSGCYACLDAFCWSVDNNPCAGGAQCSGAQVCTDFGCANVCSLDTDCALGEQCTASGHCGPADPGGTTCTDDDECAHGMICDGNVCVDGCTTDEACAAEFGAGWVCAPCGRCQPPESPTCSGGKTWCDENADCGAGRVCNIQSKCVYQCDSADPLCPLGQICADGLCVDDPHPSNPECSTSSECAAIARCDGMGCQCVNTYCRPLCDNHDQCGWGQFCDLGICRADYRPAE